MKFLVPGICLCVIMCCSTPGSGTPSTDSATDPAPFRSGFRQVLLKDYSRQYGTGPRPISTYIWYPTTADGTPMRYSIASDRKIQLLFPHLSHHHFNPYGGIVPAMLEGTLAKETRGSYEELCRVMVLVLDHYLKNSQEHSALPQAIRAREEQSRLFQISE